MDLAPKTFDAALQYANDLTEIVIEPIQWTANFDFDGQLSPFMRPPRPTIDGAAFNFNMPPEPPAPPSYVPGAVSLDPAPVYDITTPSINIGPAPAPPVLDEPESPPPPTDLTIPVAPDYVLPDVPTLLDLNLPDAPDIQIPEFTAGAPIYDIPDVVENWSWDPTPYTSDLLEKVKAKVSMMMDGGLGLEPIEQVIFQRGRSRLDIEVRRNIDTRTNEFASRGFSEPNGILAQAVDEILQGGLGAKAELNEQVVIESYKELLQNVRLGVQQGIALEQVATNLHIQEQQLSLRAAEFLRETSIAILNARITAFNARLSAYQTEAQVFQTRVQAALAEVEIYKAQIDAQRLIGEINQQQVQIYAEQIRSLSALADFYRSQIQAVQAQADVERTKIERFKAVVDAFSARWRAYGEQVGAYKAQMDAENTKATVHRNLVDAYATRTQAWGTTQGNKIALERLGLDQNGQKIAVFRAQLDKMLGLVQAESARIGGQSSRADALARIYTADAGVETAASAATDRSFQLGLERANSETQTQLRAAEIRIQENIQLTNMLIDVRKTLAQVLSQLAASSMSAMNFSASVTSSRSQSKSCATSVTWSGEAPDL
ncbi:MAG TPA: hypothetical protein VGK41_01090 [Solirubrobacterales bacterium]